MSPADPAGSIGTPIIRSPPSCPRGATRSISTAPLIARSISAIPISTRSRCGRCRRGSSCSPRTACSPSSRCCRCASGRQPRLPEWAYSGAILGLKDGANSFARLDGIIAAGAVVTGLWCEDWVGLRATSFGKRLRWDWQANEARYPGLRQRIAELADRDIRFLGYVNPYLLAEGELFAIAADAGYLARRLDGDAVYLVDFGEFDAGIVDFTNPAAAAWFAEDVIGRNMLDYGLSGWMADFGEYLPVDVRLANGADGMLMHNAWPVLWAKVNAAAIASRDRTGDAIFFMRAGWSDVGAHCPLLWAGDQSVDFSRHDGIGTVIRAALSSGPRRQRLSSQRSGRLYQSIRQRPHRRPDDALERAIRLLPGDAIARGQPAGREFANRRRSGRPCPLRPDEPHPRPAFPLCSQPVR